MPCPSANIAKAAVESTPAVSASTSARPYFCSVGRSCSMPYNRFSARSIWPMSVVPVMSAVTPTTTRTTYCPEAPVSYAWKTALVSALPAGPGTASMMVRTMVALRSVSPSAAAIPTSRITPCTSSSDVTNASERAWLNPSAARKRTNASFTSFLRPVRRSVSRASSPLSSQVSGTNRAALMPPPPGHRS